MNKLLIICALSAFFSCKKGLQCGDRTIASVNFTIIDSTTNKSLIGNDRLYHPDSIIMLNSETMPLLRISLDSITDLSV